MRNVLTAAAVVNCGHGGLIAPKNDAQVKLTVSGVPVLTATALIGQPVSPTCATPNTSAPVSKKCLACTSITSTQSTKLKVHGVSVLLDPLAGGTDGVVAPKTVPETALKATGLQIKLTTI